MSARFSTSDPVLADLVREYQNSINKLNLLQNKLEINLGSLSKERNKVEELALREKIASVSKMVSETREIIESRFPKYFQLTQLHSVDLENIQSLLKANEALISYLSTESTLNLPFLSA